MNEHTYLTAKRTIDDRALNTHVLEEFRERLSSQAQPEQRITEFGAGTGTMPVRLASWDVLPKSVFYRTIEQTHSHVESARNLVPEELASEGYTIDEINAEKRRLRAIRDEQQIRFSLEQGDAFDVTGSVDCVIACAFLDLVSLSKALPHIRDVLTTDGLLYAPITFDGHTGFVPSHPFDETVIELYHSHMERRTGSPRAGRKLLELTPEYGGEILTVGGSDWIIRPVQGEYPAREKTVISFLLTTMYEAVSELSLTGTDERQLEEWVQTRRQQVSDDSLTMIAHNVDVLCQF